MDLDRHSKIKEAWQHPVGHDVLIGLLRFLGRNKSWLERNFVANMRLASLDRLAGVGFADALVALCNSVGQEKAARLPEEEKQAWWKEAVVYHVFLPSFMDADHDGMGDIAGVIQRLPYLAKLGIDTLWIWPLVDTLETSGRSQRNYKKVNLDFGTSPEFDTFVQAAHERNMKVLISYDIAATAEEHAWFKAAKKDEKYQGYYILRKGIPDILPNNWTRNGKPAWRWIPEMGMWALHTCGSQRADLNWNNASVREEMKDVARYWLDKGVDGLCWGSANMISKVDYEDGNTALGTVMGRIGYEKMLFGPQLVPYLQELRGAVAAKSEFAAFGEIRRLGTGMAGLLAQEGNGTLDVVLDTGPFSLRRQSRGKEDAISFQELKAYYIKWMEEFTAKGWLGLGLESAEVPRMISRLGVNSVYRSVVAKLLGTMQLTLRGTPIIYQGQELGMVNTRFTSAKELRDRPTLRLYDEWREKQGEREAFAHVLNYTPDHSRTPMPWGNGKYAGFTGAEPWIRMPDGTGHMNAAVQMEDAGSVWNYYRKLIALRKEHPGLIYGNFKPVFVNSKKVFCYFRMYEGTKWYVEMNITGKEVPRPGRILRSQKLMLSNYDGTVNTLRPYEANVFLCE